ncbi:hypothetical protein PHA8399_01516 [Leisingera aquaemixtae]|uniref:Carrier domain-containing protein n=2 Tax=Leisingera aquaemixtae TaxID=1396826 RepID=A0A0P1H822_9RHOB|nr:hypothetical protein PHA8399_01516 [Leisingera aquaemixtae]
MTMRQTIKSFICEELLADDIAVSDLEDDYDLLRNGVVDSLSLVRLVAWTGEAYGVPINEIEIAPEDLATVAKIEGFIERHSSVPA